MSGSVFSTPRPVPGRLASVAASGLLLAVALPIFLVAGFPFSGWLLATTLWAAGQALTAGLTRLLHRPGTLAAAGVAGIGMSFRALAVGVPLVVVTVSNTRVGLAAVVLYGLAYTLELAVSLLTYFGGGTRAAA